MAPTELVLSWPSVIGCQELPPSVVFPDAAAHTAEIEDVGLRGNAGHRDHPACAKRPHQAESERLRKVRRLRVKESGKRNYYRQSKKLHSLEW